MLGVNLRWTSIASKGSRNTPGYFIQQTLETSASLMTLLAPICKLNNYITKMEVGCLRHPGASNIGRQLLMTTATMAGKSWQPSHEPHAVRRTGTRHTVEKVERGEGSAWGMNCHYKIARKTPPVCTCAPCYNPRAYGILAHVHNVSTPLTTRETQG